jgi:hypothetical protein
MVREPGADQIAVPGPAVLGVGGGVDADVAAAAPEVGLEGRLLIGIEHVAGGGQPDDGLEPAQVVHRERAGVLGGRHRDAVVPAQLPDGGDAGGDRRMPEAGGLAEHQDFLRRGPRLGAGRARHRSREEEQAAHNHCQPPVGGASRRRHRPILALLRRVIK